MNSPMVTNPPGCVAMISIRGLGPGRGSLQQYDRVPWESKWEVLLVLWSGDGEAAGFCWACWPCTQIHLAAYSSRASSEIVIEGTGGLVRGACEIGWVDE